MIEFLSIKLKQFAFSLGSYCSCSRVIIEKRNLTKYLSLLVLFEKIREALFLASESTILYNE